MTDEEKLEAQWGRALVHESGHVLMAVQQKIPCDGIYYMKTYRKLCNVAYLPPVSRYSTEHFLFHSAGSAAELLTYGDNDDEAAKSDRLPFKSVGAPDFEETVNKSCSILTKQSVLLESLISTLKSKCLQIGLDFDALPETSIAGVDGKLGVLLSKQELEAAGVTPRR
jgi:hypothetical protein